MDPWVHTDQEGVCSGKSAACLRRLVYGEEITEAFCLKAVQKSRESEKEKAEGS